MTKLPTPDEFGNYWFGRVQANNAGPAGPAIFPSKRLVNDDVRESGKFILFLGSVRGFLFDGNQLKRFDSAGSALRMLRELASKH